MCGIRWGELIVQLRSEQGVSQRMLAAGAVVNRSTLRKVESGESAVAMDAIERLLGYLGYELDAVTIESKVETLRRREQEWTSPERKSRACAMRLVQMAA